MIDELNIEHELEYYEHELEYYPQQDVIKNIIIWKIL